MRSLLILFILSLGATCLLAENTPVKYGPAEVNLVGIIRRQAFPGPPEYMDISKGDAKEVYWILDLEKPIDVLGGIRENNEDAEKFVEKVQLVFGVLNDKSYKDYPDVIGKMVCVSGTLYHAHTGHHKTPVLIQVRNIKIGRTSQ